MLSDPNVACVALVVALCSINENCHRWIKEGFKKRPQYTHTHTHTHTRNLMTDLMLSEPDDYKVLFFCSSTVHHLMGYTRLLPLQLLNKY